MSFSYLFYPEYDPNIQPIRDIDIVRTYLQDVDELNHLLEDETIIYVLMSNSVQDSLPILIDLMIANATHQATYKTGDQSEYLGDRIDSLNLMRKKVITSWFFDKYSSWD